MYNLFKKRLIIVPLYTHWLDLHHHNNVWLVERCHTQPFDVIERVGFELLP